MKNKPIYLWPFIILYKTPLLILHYLFTGIVFTLMAISFTWWKLVKWFMFGISFPIVIIGRAFKGDKKKNNIAGFVYGTVFVWTLITALFFLKLSAQPWYFFLLGVPIQGMLIVRYLFNYKQFHRKSKK